MASGGTALYFTLLFYYVLPEAIYIIIMTFYRIVVEGVTSHQRGRAPIYVASLSTSQAENHSAAVH